MNNHARDTASTLEYESLRAERRRMSDLGDQRQRQALITVAIGNALLFSGIFMDLPVLKWLGAILILVALTCGWHIVRLTVRTRQVDEQIYQLDQARS